MTKAKIEYLGNAEGVSWGGHDFGSGKPFETDDATLIAKAKDNQFFKVTGGDVKASDKQAAIEKQPEVSVRQRGADAKASGKARNVPPAYRKDKAKEAEWLGGYDTPPNAEAGAYPNSDTPSVNPDGKDKG